MFVLTSKKRFNSNFLCGCIYYNVNDRKTRGEQLL